MSRCALSLALLVLAGCSFTRSSREPLAAEMLVEQRHRCVLVLLPGLGDAPDDFQAHGFHQVVQHSPAPCDVVSVDAHFGYYRDAVVVDRLAGELLAPLRAQYARTWLVGVSLGGYGAALVAEARPDLVDGVVLISPFLGLKGQVGPLVQRLEAAGGLAHYQGPFAPRTHPRRHFMEVEPVWSWLQERARGEGGPRVVLAWGQADGFAWKHRVAATGLDPASVVQLEGAHTWDTFARLWRVVAAAAPWREGRPS